MADRTVVYRIQADVTQARAQVAALGASVKKSADDMTAGTKEGAKFRSGLDSLGNTAGKVGLVAAAGLGAAVLKAADFDQAMSNVQAATHESSAAMEDLRAAALKAGADTAFSATEAATGVEELAKAGVATADILGGGLSGALDLAAAGGLGVGEAAETAATALTQFKLEGADVPHVADLLAAAAGKAQGSVSDMGQALKQSGLVAAQTGLTIEETTGTLAAFASAGLVGSDAGTSFKTMLQALTPSGNKARDAMDAMGFSAYDAQGNFKGMETVAGDLREGLSTMSKEQQNATLKTIFGSDAVRAASVIYEQGADGIGGWIDKTNDAGYAAETASIKLDNLKGDLEALGGSLETALIGTGDGSEGMLRGLVQNLTDAVNAYNDLGDGAKSGVAITLGATAALGGGLFVFSKMVQSIAATRLAMTQLGVTSAATSKIMSGLGKAGFGLAGLAAGALAAEQLRKAVEESLPGMSELSGQILGISEGKVAQLGSEFDSLGSSIKRMADPSYVNRSSDAITGLLTLGILDGKEIDGARQEIDALDAALSNLATSGGTDVATKAFDDLAKAQGLTAKETKQLLSILPGYSEALAANETQATLTGDATEEVADAHVGLTKRMAKTTEQLKAEAEALDQARKAAHDTAAGFVNLTDGVDDAEVSLGEWIQQLSKQADALTNFMNNAKKASKRGLRDGLINDLQDAGTAGALRMKQLSSATDEEIAKANKAWKRGQDAMERYVNFKVPPKKVDVDNGPALSKIEALEAKLRAIKDEDVVVNIRQITSTSLGPRIENADGNILDFYANGGMRENHVAQVAPAGAWRVWAEPETGGEAYIPLAPSKRERSIDIWEEVGARLGVQFQHFADGASGGGKKKRRVSVERGDDVWASAQEARAERQRRAEEERQARIDAEADRAAREERYHAAALQAQQEHDDAVLAGQERAWEQATSAAQERVDLAQRELDVVNDSMKRIGDVATAAFSGSFFTGGGGGQHGLWTGAGGGGAAGDWRSRANASISGLQERDALISQLSGLGLTGGALEDLLGNQDNAGIAAMIKNGEIGDYATLFARQQALIQSVGQNAGIAGYGADQASATAVVARATAQLADLTAAIMAARPITVLESVSATATANELVRLLAMAGSS